MAPHSSTLAWKIPQMEEPGGLQSMGLHRVEHDRATSLLLFTFTHWRRKWQPTPVFLPGESQGQGSLVGCRLWGHTESDTTEATQQQQQPFKFYPLVKFASSSLISYTCALDFPLQKQLPHSVVLIVSKHLLTISIHFTVILFLRQLYLLTGFTALLHHVFFLWYLCINIVSA